MFVHFKHVLGLKTSPFKPQPVPFPCCSAVCCSGQIEYTDCCVSSLMLAVYRTYRPELPRGELVKSSVVDE